MNVSIGRWYVRSTLLKELESCKETEKIKECVEHEDGGKELDKTQNLSAVHRGLKGSGSRVEAG